MHYSLVNREWNESELDCYPHKNFLDLAVLYEVRSESTTISAKIRNDTMQRYGITFEELEEAAQNNQDRYTVLDIISAMTSFTPLEKEELEEMRKVNAQGPKMYVLTNEYKIGGASAMLFPHWLEGVAQKEQSDLIVIPSSIHEIIAVASNDMFKDDIAQAVQTTNAELVDEQERLSDHVYFYKRGSLQVTL